MSCLCMCHNIINTYDTISLNNILKNCKCKCFELDYTRNNPYVKILYMQNPTLFIYSNKTDIEDLCKRWLTTKFKNKT